MNKDQSLRWRWETSRPRSRWETSRPRSSWEIDTDDQDGEPVDEARPRPELHRGHAVHRAQGRAELVKVDQMGVTIKGMMVKIEGQIQTEVKGTDDPGQRRRDAADQGRHHDDRVGRCGRGECGEASHARTAAEVCRRFALGEKARSAPQRRSDSAPVPRPLAEKGSLRGRRPVSRARAPEARADLVGLRLRSGDGEEAMPLPTVAAASAAVERWLGDPSDANRRAAMTAAQAADYGVTGGLAPRWRRSCRAEASRHRTWRRSPPAENLTAVAAAGAVILAAVSREPEKADERFRSFLARGVAVGAGEDRGPARR